MGLDLAHIRPDAQLRAPFANFLEYPPGSKIKFSSCPHMHTSLINSDYQIHVKKGHFAKKKKKNYCGSIHLMFLILLK